MNAPFPIIRFELDGIRHALNVALTEHQAAMDSNVQAALDAYLTPENVQRVISSAVNATLDRVIKDEVENFFRYGDGRKVIAAEIKQRLLNNETYSPLDEVGNG